MKKVLNSFHLKLITVLLMITGRILVQYYYPAMELAVVNKTAPETKAGLLFQLGYGLYIAAVPVAGFLLVEALMHTSDRKKLLARLSIVAVLSEIAISGVNQFTGLQHYPAYRLNFYFTMLLASAAILIVELKLKKFQEASLKYNLLCLTVFILAATVAMFAGADQGQTGILILVAIYMFRSSFSMMLAAVAVLQIFLGMGSLAAYAPALSVLVLWLYNGEQGVHNKATRVLFYAAYPAAYVVLTLVLWYAQ